MAADESQDVFSILTSSETNHLIRNNGDQIPASDLVGKHVLVYFSAHWCPPCRAFTPKLVETYHVIKAKDDAFEVVFISSDRDEPSFNDYFSGMPWLALPFGDVRRDSLRKLFSVRGIPFLAAIGPTGKIITTDARGLVMLHGAEAYPFTEGRVKEILEKQAKVEEEEAAAEQDTSKAKWVCDGDTCRKA